MSCYWHLWSSPLLCRFACYFSVYYYYWAATCFDCSSCLGFLNKFDSFIKLDFNTVKPDSNHENHSGATHGNHFFKGLRTAIRYWCFYPNFNGYLSGMSNSKFHFCLLWINSNLMNLAHLIVPFDLNFAYQLLNLKTLSQQSLLIIWMDHSRISLRSKDFLSKENRD